MLSCAGAYVSGAASSNACPAGSMRIATEAACRTAATAAGKTPNSAFGQTFSYYPRGCYYNTGTDKAYFNTHAVGAGASNTQLLCAAIATTGAPPPMLARVCAGACTGTCVCAWTHVDATGSCAIVRALCRDAAVCARAECARAPSRYRVLPGTSRFGMDVHIKLAHVYICKYIDIHIYVCMSIYILIYIYILLGMYISI